MKEDRQKHLELKVDKLSEQLSSMIESSKNMEDSFRKRIEQVEHEVLDLPEDYDDIEEEDNLQGRKILMFHFKMINNVLLHKVVVIKTTLFQILGSDEGYDNKMENGSGKWKMENGKRLRRGLVEENARLRKEVFEMEEFKENTCFTFLVIHD